MGKEQFFQQIVLGQLDIHMQNNEFGPLPYTIYKNLLKTNQRHKYDMNHLEENIWEIFQTLDLAMES